MRVRTVLSELIILISIDSPYIIPEQIHVSNLVNKTDYNTKVAEIENKLTNHNHDKCIDTQEFNKLAADVLNTRLKQANLVKKIRFS